MSMNRTDLDISINNLISKQDPTDKIRAVDHREANKQILDYVDQESSSMVTNEFLSDGSTSCTLSNNYISNTIKVFRNGQRLRTSFYTELGTDQLLFNFIPDIDDIFIIDFKQKI